MLLTMTDEIWTKTGKKVQVNTDNINIYFDLVLRHNFLAIQNRADLNYTGIPKPFTMRREYDVCVETCKVGQGQTNIDSLQEKIYQRFKNSSTRDVDLRDSVMAIVTILVNNALTHSETDFCYVTVQQLRKKDEDRHRRELLTYVVVSDNGQGISNSLWKKTCLIAASDAENIKMVLRKNYRVPGEGLLRGYKYAARLLPKYDGKLFVRSGNGVAVLEKDSISTHTYATGFSGTQAYAVFTQYQYF